MLCRMFHRRRKEDRQSCEYTSFIKEPDDGKQVQKTYSSDWFSHSINVMPKDFNYIFSLIDKCIKLCVNPEINFKTNPPHLPSVLRNFNYKIMSIMKCYEPNLSELIDIYFFRVSIWTLMKQCKEILRIFRKAKSAVCDELSIPRQKLVHISFLLSHLFHAVVALFPNSYYAPETFRITKADAAEWWHSHFGLSTTVVKWKEFFHVFSKLNYVSEVTQIAALKRTINITGNGFVSIFDFDVFVRLFQPWHNIMDSWRIIALEHPGCMPVLTYEQVVQILKSFQLCPGVGSYIFRFSCTKPGRWAIGYIDVSGKIFQTMVRNKSLALALFEGEQAGLYKFPNGKLFDSATIRSLSVISVPNIVVSKEEHDAYCCIDSSFEVCKICELHDKNVRIEPCGHLLCDICLGKWQSTFRCHGCPFCRFEIKGVERVLLVPYKTASRTILSNNSNIYPIVPPRQVNIVVNRQTKVNYAKLDWLSLNDSGYCAYSNFCDDHVIRDQLDDDEADNDSLDHVILKQQMNDIHVRLDYQNGGDRVTVTMPPPLKSSKYQKTNLKHSYLNDNACSTSTNNNSAQNAMHITKKGSNAMEKLLKITGNDVTMSQEILRYFDLRSVATIT